MIIAAEIKKKLPDEASRLEQLASEYFDFRDKHLFVAQAEYQALMDDANVEDGHQLDNGVARVFNLARFKDKYDPPRVLEFGGQVYVYGPDGPGAETYGQQVESPILLPYFREDIHEKYVELEKRLKQTSNDLAEKIIEAFFWDSYKGIYLFAGEVFSDEPSLFVPSFTLRKKSGYWTYTFDFLRVASVCNVGSVKYAEISKNPWAFDTKLSEEIMAEMSASHKGFRFVDWAIGKQTMPDEIKPRDYDIAYLGFDFEGTYKETRGLAPLLAKPGGLVITNDSQTSDHLLHEFRNLRPFFTAEDKISLHQFLIKTK